MACTLTCRPWSDAEILELRRRWRAGEPYADIAVALSRALGAVQAKLKRLGLRRVPAGSLASVTRLDLRTVDAIDFAAAAARRGVPPYRLAREVVTAWLRQSGEAAHA